MSQERVKYEKFAKALEIGDVSQQGKIVIAWDASKPRHKTYTLQCTKCGYITQTSVKSFHNTCKKCSVVRTNSSSLEFIMYGKYRHKATTDGIPFTISLESFSVALHSDCIYCGKPPKQIMKTGRKYDNTLVYNGVDRIVCELGYTEGNIAPCCWVCNQAKKNYSPEEFKRMITSWFERIDKW